MVLVEPVQERLLFLGSLDRQGDEQAGTAEATRLALDLIRAPPVGGIGTEDEDQPFGELSVFVPVHEVYHGSRCGCSVFDVVHNVTVVCLYPAG